MEVKLFEVRDIATFIPVMCVRLCPRNAVEDFLFSRAGFDPTSQFVLYVLLEDPCRSAKDYYEWGSANRTHRHAHEYITRNWDKLKSGDVIDVEFILGETDRPKESERFIIHL